MHLHALAQKGTVQDRVLIIINYSAVVSSLGGCDLCANWNK